MKFDWNYFPSRRFPYPGKYLCEIGHCSQILFRSIITLGNKNSLGERGGYINTCQGGETFYSENNLINFHCASLICKIIFPLSGSGHPDKYLYEASKPSIEAGHNYSKFNWILTINFLFFPAYLLYNSTPAHSINYCTFYKLLIVLCFLYTVYNLIII